VRLTPAEALSLIAEARVVQTMRSGMLIMQTANAAGHAPAASPAPSAPPTIPASAHTKATLHSRLSHWQSTHRHTYRMAAGSNESSFLLIMV